MKKLTTLLCLVFSLIITIQAQNYTPEAFKYQGSITDNTGVPIASQTVGVEIKIEKGNPAVVVYTETHTPTTSATGTFHITIGQGTPVSGTFSAMDWANDAHNIVISVDENGGTNYQLLGTSQLLAVPYALSAKNALRINGVLVDATAPTTGQVLAYDGTKWTPSTLTIDYSNITNAPTPVVINDASTSTTEVLSASKITNDYVTVGTDQSITGKKTFTDQVYIGETGNGRELWIYRDGDFIECYDESGVLVGKLQESFLSSTGDSYFEIEAGTGRKIQFDGDVYAKDKAEFDDDVQFNDALNIYGYDIGLGQDVKRGSINGGNGISIIPETGSNTIAYRMRIPLSSNLPYLSMGSATTDYITFEKGSITSRDLELHMGTSDNGIFSVYGSQLRLENGTSIVASGTTLNVPDYVFREDYDLMSIEEHAKYMWENNHLPKVTSAKKINEGSYDIVERREQILEEVELAHIYIEQLHQQIKTIEGEKTWLVGGVLLSLLLSILAMANTYRIGRRCNTKHTV